MQKNMPMTESFVCIMVDPIGCTVLGEWWKYTVGVVNGWSELNIITKIWPMMCCRNDDFDAFDGLNFPQNFCCQFGQNTFLRLPAWIFCWNLWLLLLVWVRINSFSSQARIQHNIHGRPLVLMHDREVASLTFILNWSLESSNFIIWLKAFLENGKFCVVVAFFSRRTGRCSTRP